MANLTSPYATRLCLSGVENRRLLDTFKNFGVKHIQVSFYYLRKTFSDPIEFQHYAKPFETLIIDSGTVYGNVKNEDQKNELLKDYADYLGALDRKSFTAAVYEKGIGLDKILPDEALIYPLDDVRSVFDNDLKVLFQNLLYVGVSNKEASASGGDNLIPVFAHASKTGALVHAFGTGSRKILSKFPFFSANSSSWRSGSRYLNTYIYEGPGRGLRLYQPTDKKDPVKTEKEVKTIRRRQSNLVKVRSPHIYGQINWEEAYDGDSWEVDKGNLAQWIMFQTDLELLPYNKYFLTETQRQEINLRKQDLFGNIEPANRESDPITRDEYDDNIKEDDSLHNISRNTNSNSSATTDSSSGQGNTPLVEGEIVEGGDIEPPSIELDILKETGLDTPIKRGRAVPIDDRMRTTRNCDYCILAGRCPKYTPGAPCAYGLDPHDPSYDVDNMEHHIMTDAADLLAIQKDRILQLYLEEKADASGASKDLNREMKTYMELVALLSEATDKRDELHIKAKGTGVMDMFRKNR